MSQYTFFNRDISWLSFNERVLNEAANEQVPLLERIRFLSIYSSNLDEFYRVRIPALAALEKLDINTKQESHIQQAGTIIQQQQERFGQILTGLLPQLQQHNIHVLYKEAMPVNILLQLKQYFFTQVLAFLQPVVLQAGSSFFPENNKLYLAVTTAQAVYIVNVPSDKLSRFYSVATDGKQYIVFLEDILRQYLPLVLQTNITGTYSFKITRDAELNLQDEYDKDLADAMEEQVNKRDFGLATRFLYDPATPFTLLQTLLSTFKLSHAGVMPGGVYHNLKDLGNLPISNKQLEYIKWPALQQQVNEQDALLDAVEKQDIVLHAPWQSYDTVLRFFNEAATHVDVTEIYVTLYRVATDSRIVNALISAARNGKKVYVLVELKARFDEANNIKWAKQMKAAGVKIIYSVTSLKVHAKIALVKKRTGIRDTYLGLLATGNLNESTARFYTDHILLTAHAGILRELELLFIFLSKRKKQVPAQLIAFRHLLVAQFNLQQQFLALINREIEHAKKGLSSGIIIKLNNLEEKVLISKLYEASNAGVRIQLIVRSICCLIPGITGQSENITITRIVDRYLEHGRIFIFNNNNNEEIYMGSADWMNRNIYRRIEVCFPVYDSRVKEQMKHILLLQLQDNVQAVYINQQLANVPVPNQQPAVQSQQAIYEYLKQQA